MWNRWVRQSHRWASLVFMTIVASIFIALGAGREPASWVYLLPLVPLALLVLTGLYMFCLPHAARWQSSRRVVGAGEVGHAQAERVG